MERESGGRRRTLPPSGRRARVDLELLHHVQEKTDRLIDEGWDPQDARAEAERVFGDLGQWRSEVMSEDAEHSRRRWIVGGVDSLVQDVRYAIRSIRRNPGFAASLVATLALGIGATAAVFSVVDAVMFRPLPYEQADRLVDAQLEVSSGFTIPELMAEQARPWTNGADFLQSHALHSRRSMVRTDSPEPEQLSVLVASHDLDDVLGAHAVLGRTFVLDDALPGARSLILSWEYWKSHGGEPGILGTTVELDDQSWTVVGVLRRGMKYPVAGTTDLWIPLATDETAAGRSFSQLGVVGRLSEGVSLASAQERSDALGSSLAEEYPLEVGWSISLSPVGRWRGNSDTLRGLWVVSGAVAMMFLIAVFNSTNLFLVRAHSREGEVGIRKALGASRYRVVRQILAESVVLSLLAGMAATAVAWLCVEGIRLIAPRELTFGMVHDFGLEARAFAVVFLTAAATGIAVGMLPALRLGMTALKNAGSSREQGRDRTATRLRTVLVAVEVAASVVLLIGAGLLLRSFAVMQANDFGMDTDRIAFAELQLPSARYSDGADRALFVRDALGRMAALPGVDAVVAAQGAPPEGGGITFGVGLQGEGREVVPGEHLIPFGSVPDGYLAALGTTLLDGRELRPSDRDSDGVVINADLARTLFGTTAVVGRRFRLGEDDDWLSVVGVVESLRFGGVDDRQGSGVILYPLDPDQPPRYLNFVVRTSGDPADVLPGIRAAILDVDRRLPLIALQTGRDALGDSAHRPRFLVLLVSVLAGIALLLAAVGLYGVLAYVVRRRRREMGIRIALGAPLSHVQGGLMRWGLGVGLAGTVAGLLASTLVDDFMAALLYGVEPGDTATSALAALTMLLVTLLACAIPARRAARVNPVEVLQAE